MVGVLGPIASYRPAYRDPNELGLVQMFEMFSFHVVVHLIVGFMLDLLQDYAMCISVRSDRIK